MSAPSPFFRLEPPIPDPIFTAAERAKKAGKEAIDGTIGVILDEEGKLLVFDCIKKALKEMDMMETGYPPLAGVPAYLETVKKLCDPDMIDRATAVAAPGGTGALSVLLRLSYTAGYRNILMPTPSWVNHKRMIEGMGFSLKEVQYISAERTSFKPLIEGLKSNVEPSIILLQSACHNPTGQDVQTEEWQLLADAVRNTDHTVLLDSPYQGIGEGITEDMLPLHTLVQAGHTPLVAWSGSKNHCLYGLRAGVALAYASDEKQKTLLQKHLTISLRSLSSVAPVTGQHVVARVQEKYRDEWETELNALRTLLKHKREVLANSLPDYAEIIRSSKGMFVQLPLSVDQVETLTKHNVFLTPDGRVNLAGIPLEKMEVLGNAIAAVIL